MHKRKFRNGTKKWKQKGHKTICWYYYAYGLHGINTDFLRNGKSISSKDLSDKRSDGYQLFG